MTHSRVSATPSLLASAPAISTWKPCRSPSLLAKGSALGCAHSVMAPLSLIDASVRASTGVAGPTVMISSTVANANPASTAILLRPPCVALVGFESVNVMDNALDLIIAQGAFERRHGAFLARLDAIDD